MNSKLQIIYQNQTDITLPNPRTEYLKRTLGYNGAKLWNSLPQHQVAASISSSISFPEPAIPWEGNGGSGIIRDRHTKNCMSPVLRMRWK